MPWTPAYVGIGSNLQQPLEQVLRAFALLAKLALTRLEVRSSLYESEPMGPAEQPRFINAVAGLLTQQELRPLFEQLRTLELQLGKQPPPVRWGPRIIDLDLLLYGQQCVQDPDLTLPHPGIVQRNFVLYPLRDVAPDLRIPGRGRVGTLAAGVDTAGIWRLNDDITTHGA
jgi:2-amino-4-hydroxy-6-hydroxymethyldihydropteridine diphosphokinase